MTIEASHAPEVCAGNLPEALEELPLPYLELDTRGVITSANRAARALYPPHHGDVIGKFAYSSVALDEQESDFAEFVSLMESGRNPPVVLRTIFVGSGHYRTFQLHRSILRDAERRPAGMRLIGVDVSGTQQALDAARRRNLWLESVLNSMHEAVIATDAMGAILGLNPAAEELLGSKEAELVGRTIEEGIKVPGFEAGDKSFVTFVMGLIGKQNGLTRLVDRQGRESVVRVWSSPVIDKGNGCVSGVVYILCKPGALHEPPDQRL